MSIAAAPPAAAAGDVVERFRVDLSKAALELLNERARPSDYLSALLDGDLFRDARHFLAHALPKRRALWWACLCAWDVRDAAPPGLAEAVERVVDFVCAPSEAGRRAAERVYRSEPLSSLAGMLAAAAYYSTGSIAPADAATPVPPANYVTGRLVSTAVYLAATIKDVARYKLAVRDYVLLGEQVARGENLWPQDEGPGLLRVDGGGRRHALAGMHALPRLAPDAAPAALAGVLSLHRHAACGCGTANP